MNDTAPETPAPVKPKPRKKKTKRNVPFAHVYITATFNNTIISITDKKGGLLVQSSAGSSGFRGSKKGTAYAAQIAAIKAIDTAKQQFGLSKVDVLVKGIGLGRDAAIRSLTTSGADINSITDVTSIAHGGCRPRRARRA